MKRHVNYDNHWQRYADTVLSRLFEDGTPSDAEIRDAYPFGPRRYWPYKIWLDRVCWFKDGCPAFGYRRPESAPLPGQEALL